MMKDNKTAITVVKVGGAVVEDATALSRLLTDFAAIPGRKILVHGGGRRATKVAEALGIKTTMVGDASPTQPCSKWSLWSMADWSTRISWLDCKP